MCVTKTESGGRCLEGAVLKYLPFSTGLSATGTEVFKSFATPFKSPSKMTVFFDYLSDGDSCCSQPYFYLSAGTQTSWFYFNCTGGCGGSGYIEGSSSMTIPIDSGISPDGIYFVLYSGDYLSTIRINYIQID